MGEAPGTAPLPVESEILQRSHHKIAAANGKIIIALSAILSTPSCMNPETQTSDFDQTTANAEYEVLPPQHDQELSHRETSGTTHDMHVSHVTEEEKEARWQSEQAAYEKALQLAEKSQEQVYSPEELAAAFSTEVEVFIGCMDERVQIPGMKKIGVGGSCILMTEEQIDRFIQKLAEKGINVKFVSSHEGCGACDVFCKQHGLESDEAPRLAKDTAAKVTQKLGKEEGAFAHIPFAEMEGHAHLHHARAITVDCFGFFRPKMLGFPATFELTAAAYPDTKKLEEELALAVAITEGDHGMGADRYDIGKNGEPLLITIIEDPSDPVLTAAVTAIVEKIAAAHPKTVKVIRLQAPARVA